ncbi:MAG: hypothetical protein JWP34_4524, partial [Massilia sp.]|nr:hypothetical protein [Massilia sp.]
DSPDKHGEKCRQERSEEEVLVQELARVVASLDL